MNTEETSNPVSYVRLWARLGAMIIDTIIISIVVYILSLILVDESALASENAPPTQILLAFLISFVLPAIAIILFWVYLQATPGKLVVGARIVRADNGMNPSVGQCIGRYFSYFLSGLILGLGYLWVAFDKRKQGWHDKLAGTVVVRR